MCVKEFCLDFLIIGLILLWNFEMVKGLLYFDEVYMYDDLKFGNGVWLSFYFDVLGNEFVLIVCFEYFIIKCWWIYG